MKITKNTITSVQLDYADVHAKLAEYNGAMLEDLVLSFTDFRGKISQCTALELAKACLKGEGSKEFQTLMHDAGVMWITTPEDMYGYTHLVEDFPLLFLPEEVFECGGKLAVYVGGYTVDVKKLLQNV